MQLRNRFIFTLTTALTLLSGATAYAQKKVAVEDVAVIATPTRSLSNTQILGLKEMVNPLKAPDTSDVIADTTEGPDPKGVMTKNGPVYFDDYSVRAFGPLGLSAYLTPQHASRLAIRALREQLAPTTSAQPTPIAPLEN